MEITKCIWGNSHTLLLFFYLPLLLHKFMHIFQYFFLYLEAISENSILAWMNLFSNCKKIKLCAYNGEISEMWIKSCLYLALPDFSGDICLPHPHTAFFDILFSILVEKRMMWGLEAEHPETSLLVLHFWLVLRKLIKTSMLTILSLSIY